MSERPYNEKDEKDEKERDKHEEKTMEEKYRRDPLGTILWAAVLIWAGLVFLADNLGLLSGLNLPNFPPAGPFFHIGAWPLIFIGAGVILWIGAVLRALVPEYRRSLSGDIVLGAIFVAIGLGDLVGWGFVWPIVLIAIGLSIIVRRPRGMP